MFRRAASAVAACALLGAAASAWSDTSKVMIASRADGPVRVDGRLDEPTWAAASFHDDLVQKDPHWGAPPSVRTEIAVAYDSEALYVGARMHAAHRSDIQAMMTRRDETASAERIIVSLDTFRNRRTAVSFAVTAAGVRADWIHPDDSEYDRDASFDPVWEGAALLAEDGWTAELRIPFTQLRFPDGDEQRWGIDINRYVPSNNEDIFWIPVPKDRTAWASVFGELRGLRGVTPPLRLEILPYVGASIALAEPGRLDPEDPFAEEVDLGGSAGVDAKLGLGPSFTLDATVNPDFGQVEADPAVVNLSAFETSFAEQRPFFVEGAALFGNGGSQFFYSRRIGAAPRLEPRGDHSDAPASTRILGAAKLTGVLPSGLAIGALAAVTGAATGRGHDATTGAITEQTVAPLAAWSVVRAEQELDDDGSVAGATLTAVGRHLDEPRLEAALPRAAVTGGADLRWRSDGGTYELGTDAGFSLVSGSPDAMTAIQRASAHWFQRPDADHVELDPAATLLAGWRAAAKIQKRSGRWVWDGFASAESPGYELNDLGLLQSADDVDVGASLRYRHPDPGCALYAWDAGGGASTAWNFGGTRKPGSTWFDANLTLLDYWETGVSMSIDSPGLSDDLTRGGPLMSVGWAQSGSIWLGSGHAGRTAWNVSIEGRDADTGESNLSASASLSLRPVDRLGLSITPRALTARDTRQYLAAVDRADGGGPTFGVRHVFATVERRELAAQLRAQLAFTPDLALDAYLEPFASTASYGDFGELAAPRRRDLRRYGEAGTSIARTDAGYQVSADSDSFLLEDPDFTVLSLRSTVVLRWEFRPGSSLYAVWQQDRGDERARALDAARALGEAFTAAAEHTLALKLSYWWSP